jgi:hypothetical protein
MKTEEKEMKGKNQINRRKEGQIEVNLVIFLTNHIKKGN